MSTNTQDSAELEALFDSVAADVAVVPEAPTVLPSPEGDNPELEALFDSVSAQAAPVPQPKPAAAEGNVFNRLGSLTRQLHDTLRELGYDKVIEASVSQLPDASNRLAYIATKTEEAAFRALNAVDAAQPLQETLASQADELSGAWDAVLAGQVAVADFPPIVHRTRDYLKSVPQLTAETNGHLTDIMMAQDFQDLTGQVIKRVVELAQRMEGELLQILLAAAPAEKRIEVEKRIEAEEGLLNGPVINPEERTDVVANQEQVDDLLESLGF